MFFPFAWGLTMGAYRIGLRVDHYWADLPKYLVGAFILRGSAVTVNDIFDRHVDANVERTKHRPLPSGRVSVFGATIFLLVQYAIGIIFLYFTQKGLALYVALFQLLPLFAIYPLLKRITYWPQAFLGIAMNFGFITSWIATTGSIDKYLILTVMTGCWFWTVMYDTIYACQDRADDIKAGVSSTAVLFGSWVRPIMKLFAAIFVSLLAVAGYLNQQGPFYFVLSVGGTAVQLIWRFSTLDLDVDQHCWRDFNRNAKLGWIIWVGLLLDYVTKAGVIPLSSM
jgi:4-hydroxybenzoate polyprenyltransferase